MIKTSIALLALATVATACHTNVRLTWDDIAAQKPPRVLVTRADNSIVEVSGPQVFNDTLVGYIGQEFYELPTQQIERVTVKRSAKGKTMALVAAGIAGAAMVGIIISGAGEESAVSRVDCNDEPDNPLCNGQGMP